MAYKNTELIKKFNVVRDYIRDFFLYGYKKRGDFEEKSKRTYEEHYRQIRSWLKEYMYSRQSASGKAQMISVDSREVIHNPLYKAFKTRSFTDLDLLLHFFILDILSQKKDISISDMAKELQGRYFDAMKQDEVIRESDKSVQIAERPVRAKLQHYTELGLLTQRIGVRNTQYYSLAPDQTDLSSWFDAISFFSEISPVGVVGSFLLDHKKIRDKRSYVCFKHHYMLYAVESEVAECILEGIHEKKFLEITTKSKRKKISRRCVYPVKLYVSTQNGREYLLFHEVAGSGLHFVRLDKIIECKVKEKCKNEQRQKYEKEYELRKPNLWGVICGREDDMTHVEITMRIKENEEYMIRRLEREKRNGHVERIGKEKYKYVVDTYDAMELMPWIRTFTGRIERVESDNPELGKKFCTDMEKMYAMYLGGDDDAVVS